jgi:hypothetical protein
VLGCLRAAVRVSATVLRLKAAGRPPMHLHAHFAHDPALVALLVHRLTGLTYTFTAHARDLLQIPASNLARRAAEAEALVTCCQANADYIDATVPATASHRHGWCDTASTSTSFRRPSPDGCCDTDRDDGRVGSSRRRASPTCWRR